MQRPQEGSKLGYVLRTASIPAYREKKEGKVVEINDSRDVTRSRILQVESLGPCEGLWILF